MGTYLLLQKPKMSEQTTHKELKRNESKKKTHLFWVKNWGHACKKMVTEQALASSLLSDCEFL